MEPRPTSKCRSVLTTNFYQPKASTMLKSVGLVLDTNLALPNKVADGYTDTVRRHDAKPRIEEENMGLGLVGLGLHTNRKRRLNHLSFEEKLKRKKLKNRVAAQTSRDRKKARMDELEAEVKQLQEENNLLFQQNFDLQMEKEKLAAENQHLQKELSHQKTVAIETQTGSVGCRPLIGPAASVVDPLPQGRGLQPALGLCKASALLRILTFCILSQISFRTTENQTTTLTNLKSLQQVCFEKLMKTNKRFRYRVTRLLTDATKSTALLKWWGPQQNTWNPVENQVPIQA